MDAQKELGKGKLDKAAEKVRDFAEQLDKEAGKGRVAPGRRGSVARWRFLHLGHARQRRNLHADANAVSDSDVHAHARTQAMKTSPLSPFAIPQFSFSSSNSQPHSPL